MPSSFQTEFSASVLPDLFATFGETVVVFAGRNEQSGRNVTACVSWRDVSIDASTGREIRQLGDLTVREGSDITRRDAIEVQGNVYQVTAVSEPANGVEYITVQRFDGEWRRGAKGVL